MAVEANTNVTTDFAKAQSIDFVNRFVSGIAKLQELLGITRRTVLSNGSVIKTYQSKVTLADGTALSPAEVTALSPDGLTVRVVLRQGVYHQIKRMFGVYGAGVNALHREAIGGLALDAQLAPGQWRELSDEEVGKITR